MIWSISLTLGFHNTMTAILEACCYFRLLDSCSCTLADRDLRKRQGCFFSESRSGGAQHSLAVMLVSVKLTQSGKDPCIDCFVNVSHLVLEKRI